MKRAWVWAFVGALLGCAQPSSDALQGYGEADYIYVSSQDGGVIASLSVREGDAIAQGAPLFALDRERVELSAQSADAAQSAARARALNALNDAVRNAQASFALAQSNFDRTTRLSQEGFASTAQMDRDRAARDSARALVQQAEAERDAATRDAAAAQAQARLAQARVDDAIIAAPVLGSVERIFRRPGEVIAPGEPVLALLPPDNMKIRFFAPEPRIAQMNVGDEVAVACDGCAENLRARISFIASEPQFTPPVIYSEDHREKLVFLVEARLETPGAVRPGLPVDITILP